MILLTGGLGFLGLHTAAKLLSEGHDVLIVDNLSGSRLEMLERLEYVTDRLVTFVRQDIRNTPAIQRIFEQYGVTAVAHFAGVTTTQAEMHPLEIYNTNVSGLLSILQVMSRTGVNTLLYGSSSSVYAASDTPVTEEHDLEPLTAFARSFDMCEQILHDIDSEDPWRIAIMRYFEVAGSHSSHILGDWPRCAPDKFLSCLSMIADGEHDYYRLSSNLPTADGTAIGDYVHVEDAAEANMQALAYIHSKEAVFDVFNVGSGKGASAKQVCTTFEQVCSLPIDTQEKDAPEWLAPSLVADISRANKLLNWQPKYNLEQICDDAWQFYEKLMLYKQQNP